MLLNSVESVLQPILHVFHLLLQLPWRYLKTFVRVFSDYWHIYWGLVEVEGDWGVSGVHGGVLIRSRWTAV